MGKFDGVLLASDFDNTILNTEIPRRTGCPIPPISRRNTDALRYFMANGGRFAVATGRALPAFRLFADQIPMNAPAVVCNGGALYDFQTESYLDIMELPEEIRGQGQAVLDRFPTAAVEAYHLDDVIHAVRPNLYTRQHEHVTHAGVEPVSALTDVPVPLVKIMFEDDHEHLTALRDYVLQQAWSENYEIFFSDRTLLEVTRKGASKGAMVARLAQRLGISPAHIYCAGDENNDLSMLTMAAEGFAPANCAETVRNCGATIVADCDHDTLAEIIARVGQTEFRHIEEEVNAHLQLENTVISPGGSVIYGPNAMAHLRDISRVVYLQLSYGHVAERLGDLAARGVTFAPGQTLLDLYNERCPLYEQYAHIILPCDGKSIDEIVRMIRARL